MTANKLAFAIAPALLMLGLCFAMTGAEAWLTRIGTTPGVQMLLGRVGIALPYVIAAAAGLIFLFAAAGAAAIRTAGWGVMVGGLLVIVLAALREQGVTLSVWSDEEKAKFRQAALAAWGDFATTDEAKALVESHTAYLKQLGLVK